ncbi:MAG: hypothetical protein IKI83_05365 [Prevotella sp.]|nr:hypothetical protein [Prevotella sp.]
MTNPFNFETRTVKLNSDYEMPIIGIGTFYLSTTQAEESVYNALKVGMRLIDTADIYGSYGTWTLSGTMRLVKRNGHWIRFN